MLEIKKSLSELDFKKLMEIYIEGNIENAADMFPEASKEEGIKLAEDSFYKYLKDDFFAQENVLYAIWEENGEYISALRLEPYFDGLLLEALETKPSHRQRGYAVKLIDAAKEITSEKIYAHISKRNVPSLKTHEKCGFERISETAVYSDGSVNEYCCTVCLIR